MNDSRKGDVRIMRRYMLKTDVATGRTRFLDADIEANAEKPERAFYMKNVLELTLRLTKYVVK